MPVTKVSTKTLAIGSERMARLGLVEQPMPYVDGMNLYQAFGDNPINRVDPSGKDLKNDSDVGVLVYVGGSGWRMAEPHSTVKGDTDFIWDPEPRDRNTMVKWTDPYNATIANKAGGYQIQLNYVWFQFSGHSLVDSAARMIISSNPGSSWICQQIRGGRINHADKHIPVPPGWTWIDENNFSGGQIWKDGSTLYQYEITVKGGKASASIGPFLREYGPFPDTKFEDGPGGVGAIAKRKTIPIIVEAAGPPAH